MTIKELVEQYGTSGIGIVVEEFVLRAPEFPGDEALAGELGKMMSDLRSALESSDVHNRLDER